MKSQDLVFGPIKKSLAYLECSIQNFPLIRWKLEVTTNDLLHKRALKICAAECLNDVKSALHTSIT